MVVIDEVSTLEIEEDDSFSLEGDPIINGLCSIPVASENNNVLRDPQSKKCEKFRGGVQEIRS